MNLAETEMLHDLSDRLMQVMDRVRTIEIDWYRALEALPRLNPGCQPYDDQAGAPELAQALEAYEAAADAEFEFNRGVGSRSIPFSGDRNLALMTATEEAMDDLVRRVIEAADAYRPDQVDEDYDEPVWVPCGARVGRKLVLISPNRNDDGEIGYLPTLATIVIVPMNAIAG